MSINFKDKITSIRFAAFSKKKLPAFGQPFINLSFMKVHYFTVITSLDAFFVFPTLASGLTQKTLVVYE